VTADTAPRFRLNWDEYFLGIAEAVAARGDCTRRQVGAIIVDGNNRIISTGYNGTLPGHRGCLKGECPRGRHYEVEREPDHEGKPPGMYLRVKACACGRGWPCDEAVEPGSSYDTGPGMCIALHAEQNCLLYAFRDVAGMTMYLTDEPCDGCVKILRGARLGRVLTLTSEFCWDLPWLHDNY
jgi:dCMP deaminase